MYAALKLIHVTTAILSIAGFTLRGAWMLQASPLLQLKIVRIAPHVIDTVFLLSGVALIWLLALPVMSQPWLLAKFAALLFYIGFGMVAMRFGKTRAVRAIAYFAALATFAYIVGVALSKSLLSWLAIALS
jgi:uncharacterized membrane protein SirB2